MTDLTYAEYDDLPGIRSSQLKLAGISPLHFHASPPKKSRALDSGSALHCAVFEPDQLFERFVVYPKARQGKEWKAFRDYAEGDGKTVLYPADWDKACGMRAAVLRHPLAAALVTAPGACEETLQWTDEETGLLCKVRLDKRMFDRALIWDLKQARRLDDWAFSRAIHDYGYHISAAHYLAGAKAELGQDYRWMWVAVEPVPPHDVRVGTIHEDALYEGEQERMRLLRLIADCTERDEWPGAYPGQTEFDLPSWAYASMDEEVDRMTISRISEGP